MQGAITAPKYWREKTSGKTLQKLESALCQIFASPWKSSSTWGRSGKSEADRFMKKSHSSLHCSSLDMAKIDVRSCVTEA